MYSLALSISPFALASKAKAFKRSIVLFEADEDADAAKEWFTD